MRRFGRFCAGALVLLVVLGLAAWGALALWYRAPFAPPFRASLAAAWCVVGLVALVLYFRGRWRLAAATLGCAMALLFGWWSTLLPSNHRDWAVELSRAPRGSINGDTLTIGDVRDFDWRSEEDFTPRWETRVYDLRQLASVDLVADYWAGEAIAHTIVSFGFADGRYLAWSIELRRDKTQHFSAIEGFFKQAELIALAGDERDLIRLRTNARREDLRLYRLRVGPEAARAALVAYVDEANDLADHPRWYNTATTNCTTVVFKIARMVEPGAPLDWRVLFSGYFPDFAYDHGVLDTSLPFPALREASKISTRAINADASTSESFSRAIRAGLPEVATDQPSRGR
jgi:hypothetical protein